MSASFLSKQWSQADIISQCIVLPGWLNRPENGLSCLLSSSLCLLIMSPYISSLVSCDHGVFIFFLCLWLHLSQPILLAYSYFPSSFLICCPLFFRTSVWQPATLSPCQSLPLSNNSLNHSCIPWPWSPVHTLYLISLFFLPNSSAFLPNGLSYMHSFFPNPSTFHSS